jgi:hypothetical protein
LGIRRHEAPRRAQRPDPYNVVKNNGWAPALDRRHERHTRASATTSASTPLHDHGAIFVEISDAVNLVDHNVVWGGTGNHDGTIPSAPPAAATAFMSTTPTI